MPNGLNHCDGNVLHDIII